MFNKIGAKSDDIGYRVMVLGGGGEGGRRIYLQQAFGQIFKDDVNGFSSCLAICFML